MMRQFSMFLTPSHFSVTVANGATRQTSAASLGDMIAALPVEDRKVLVAVSRGILALAEGETASPAVITVEALLSA